MLTYVNKIMRALPALNKERFDQSVEQLEAIGETVPEQEVQAVDFLLFRLDPSRFSQLKKADIENNSLLGIGNYPDTLTDASYNIAQNYKITFSSCKGGPEIPTLAQNVYLASDGKNGKQNSKSNKKSGNHKKQDDDDQNKDDNKKGSTKYGCMLHLWR